MSLRLRIRDLGAGTSARVGRAGYGPFVLPSQNRRGAAANPKRNAAHLVSDIQKQIHADLSLRPVPA